MAMTRAAAERLLSYNLITPRQMPLQAGRVCETWVKRKLARLEDRAVREQMDAYVSALGDLRNAAERIAGSDPPVRSQRQAIMGAWRDIVSTLEVRVAQIAARAAEAAYLGGYYGRAWLLDMITREDVGIDVPRPEVARALRRMFEQGGDEWRWSGDLWALLGAEWQEAYALEMDDLLLRLERALVAGIRAGEGMQPIMRRVADAMGVEIDWRRGPLGSAERAGYRANFNRVQAITRTYVMDASNQGAADIYRQNGDLLAGMQHLTARDERVCPTCRAMDGHMYEIGSWEVPPRNTHPNCRCTIVPAIREDYRDVYLVMRDRLPRQTFSEWSDLNGAGLLLGMFLGV